MQYPVIGATQMARGAPATDTTTLGELGRLPPEVLLHHVLPYAAAAHHFYARFAATCRAGRTAAREVAGYVVRQHAFDLCEAARPPVDAAHATSAVHRPRFTERDAQKASHYLRVLSGAAPMERALSLVRKKPERALTIFADLSARWPGSPGLHAHEAEAYVLLGTRQFQASSFVDAEGSFRNALQRVPHLFEATFGLGTTLLSTGDYRGSLPWLEEATKQNEKNVQALCALGKARLALGQPRAAAATFCRVPKRNQSSCFDYFLGLGASLQQQGYHAEAAAHYLRAECTYPSYSIFPYLRAEVLRAQGHWREAIEGYARAELVYRSHHTLSPMYANLYGLDTSGQLRASISLGRGLSRRALGEHQAAINDLVVAVASGKDTAAAQLALGESYGALGNHASAFTAYSRAFRLQPNVWEVGEGWLRAGRAALAAPSLGATTPAPSVAPSSTS